MASTYRQSSWSRREVVKTGVFVAAAAAIPLHRSASAGSDFPNRIAESKLPKPFSLPFQRLPLARPLRSDATTDYYDITMTMFDGEVIPGYRTPLFGYNRLVPGPTIRQLRGRRAKVRMSNRLPSTHPYLRYVPTASVHLHGAASLPQYDGYAGDAIATGFVKDYIYENRQEARTIWYHDHGQHHTAENMYMGLAAQYHILDPADSALGLPENEFDVGLLLGDAMFEADGRLLFSYADDSGMWGDVNLVNGRPWPVMKVKRRKYRFRLCNGAVSRSFGLELDSGDPLVVVGTDAGLMPAPQPTKRLRISNGERYEVVVDFAKFPPGKRIVLRNVSPKNNEDFTHSALVMAFDVIGDSFDPAGNSVPAVLRPDNPVMTVPESSAVATRTLRLHRSNGLWQINDTTWDDIVASGYKRVEARPANGSTEIWEFRNTSGGWFHPMHLHLADFRMLTRNGAPVHPYERGPKDVAYLGENEVIRVLLHFEGSGNYMLHCHNAVHEDHDMMTQFEVVDSSGPGPSPLSAPAVPIGTLPPL